MADTIPTTAALIAEAILPLSSALQAGDEDIAGFVRRLGWDLPVVPSALHDLQPSSSSLVQHLAQLEVAQLAAEDDTGDDSAILEALGLAAADLAALTASIGELPDKLRAQLPAGYLVESGIADKIEQRLLDLFVADVLRRRFPLTYQLLFALGLVDETDQAADPAHHQPRFILYQVRWDRIPKVFGDPVDLLQEVYGWGTPILDTERLFEAIRRLSTALLGPATFDFPDDNLIRAVAPGVVIAPEEGPEPLLVVPLLDLESIAISLAVYPVATVAPGELQGLALTLVVTGDVSVTTSLSDNLSLSGEAAADLTTGAALVLRPGQVPSLKSGLSGPDPVALHGRVSLRLTYADAEGGRIVLLSVSGGSVFDTQQVYLVTGVDGRTTGGVDAFIEAGLVGGRVLLETEQVDGFLARLLPADGIEVGFDFGLGWSRARGVYFSGSAGLEANVGLHISIGPLYVRGLHLALAVSGAALQLETSVTADGRLGPVTASVERVGLAAGLEFQRGNLGPVDLRLGFKPPNGLGIQIDAGPIVGGGYLFIDVPNGRYAGVLELKLYEITVKAIGLIDTKLPDDSRGFSFLIVISTDFTPVQLGFGFTLNGVGGLAGINRTMQLDTLRAGVRAHALDSILFPDDPVRDAPRIISDLRAVFPPAEGRYVFGPMLRLGWGTPTLIQAQVGIVLELPAPVRLAILGQVQAALPAEDAPLVELHLDVVGTVDFGARKLAIDASLYDSRIAVWSVLGDAALRLDWGEDPNFAFSVGGFHPQFKQLPAGFPSLRRLTASVGLGNNPRFSLDSYFAITSNTVQFGAHAELYAALAGFELHGFASFDALIVLAPFGFVTQLRAGVDLSFEGIDLFGVHLDLLLAGPAPWVADGSASFDILLWTISVHVHVQFGPERPPPLPRKQVLDPLAAALANPQSWSAALPEGAERAVSLAATTPGDTTIAVHPLGTLTARQTVVPLATPITRFAGVAPDDGDTFRIASTTVNGQPEEQRDVTDLFARGQYMEFSDADKLAAQPYERFPSGVSVGGTGVLAGRDAPLEVRYETPYVPDPFAPPTRGPIYGLFGFLHLALAEQGAAALSAVRATGMAAYTPPGTVSAVRVGDARYVVASTEDLSVRYDLTAADGVTQHMATAVLAAHLALHPQDAGGLQVLPVHEAVGVPG